MNIGEAVGVIAAQSITSRERWTMRTFHVMAPRSEAELSNIEAAIGGKVKLENEAW